ncbi:tRNA (adenosine(37)-N6)-threonylcarbamoyltransferase complex dimerization subunit type 1 TsaB [Paracoccus sp. S-4012]|uniref:tRNA (adenosine(37)-N6)-threonylcarbamoyltransferase complex dimerization subunit type 1 TsaB n=1 Tax=Paracoccus sp. S-4012 TaxID=2665648 RepID=UPI0012AF363B|nr:tRNA (adenosine(37)-N6)-threonylcarbamoyltransferase complex dimerization subunit type 1 TsaB [Paracoccus sp. S-4012]MRX49429.1 tRNA (adenosine(37)-N6)-threonylcarbamoyltransferase complex dimerization subunit type 1 TsaB [Paracoccus sp. S-4012]
MSPEPLILGFDTSAAHCAAALLCPGEWVETVHEEMPRGQAERLFPMLEALLAGRGAEWRDLAAIGVGIGPGSFTGVRIAVAAARGLALSLDIPAIGVTTTEAMGFGLPRPCRVVLPGPGGQSIWQDFPEMERPELGADPPPGPPEYPQPVPLAEAVARIAASRIAHPGARPAPLYLRPADAAPARDQGPAILPG